MATRTTVFALAPLLKWTAAHNPAAVLVVGAVDDVARFGCTLVEGTKVVGFEYASGRHEPGLVSTGALLLSSSMVTEMPLGTWSLEQDLLPELIDREQLDAYVLTETDEFFDIGEPSAYDTFCTRMSEAQ